MFLLYPHLEQIVQCYRRHTERLAFAFLKTADIIFVWHYGRKYTGRSAIITKNKGGSTMANIKRTTLIVLSVVFLMVGVLGIADVKFFASNTMLELVEIAMGVGGLVIAAR
jgi:hypothetical protein